MITYKDYASQNISIFPCNINKAPATPHGFKNATIDIETLNKLFFKDNLFIGLPTGKVNGIVVVDFDVKDGWTIDSLYKAIKEYGPLPDTFTVDTPSGGRHFYYYDPETELSSHVRFFHKSIAADIRANNGYVIAPGSEGYEILDNFDDNPIENFYDKLAPLPDWIKNFRKEQKTTETALTITLPESEIREIRSALNYIDSDDRDTWVKVGMALRSTGCESARGLWDEWSQKSEKFNAKDQAAKWQTFKPSDITIASVFHMAKRAGWETTYREPDILPPVIPPAYTEPELKKMPEEFFKPGGLVQDIFDYIIGKSIRPQPIFALAAALTAVGALIGRKYETVTNIRSNIYCLCVGPSGCGKETPRSALKTLFRAAGCPDMASTEDIASDTAIVTTLEEHPSQVFLLDEIGRFIKTTNNSKNTYLFNVVTLLLRLYSSANGVFSGKKYGDKSRNVVISNPNLCIYGTTVPETFYKGLPRESIDDGFLNRMFVFETDTPRPKRNTKLHVGPPPLELLDQIRALNKKTTNVSPDGNLDHVENVKPYTVPMSVEALSILDEYYDHIDEKRNVLAKAGKPDSIYTRTVQLAQQVALIVAVGKNMDTPVIGEDEIVYGIQLANHLSEYMNYIVENFIAGNELEHEVKRLEKIIHRKGRITLSEITRLTQHLRGHERQDVLATLEDSDVIYRMKGTEKTRGITWFYSKTPDLLE
ncbi:MAG: bifunctional DNA primase/polymerase [Candidatus Omnitrophica bacterium]|nr:bifunctional DNA primase/polymerase [Candidatus Omnitrophota bacterium]